MAKRRHLPIPADFPVRPLRTTSDFKATEGHDRTCGHCGLAWNDRIPTAHTPAPAARCPFEEFHLYPKSAARKRPKTYPFLSFQPHHEEEQEGRCGCRIYKAEHNGCCQPILFDLCATHAAALELRDALRDLLAVAVWDDEFTGREEFNEAAKKARAALRKAGV